MILYSQLTGQSEGSHRAHARSMAPTSFASHPPTGLCFIHLDQHVFGILAESRTSSTFGNRADNNFICFAHLLQIHAEL